MIFGKKLKELEGTDRFNKELRRTIAEIKKNNRLGGEVDILIDRNLHKETIHSDFFNVTVKYLFENKNNGIIYTSTHGKTEFENRETVGGPCIYITDLCDARTLSFDYS